MKEAMVSNLRVADSPLPSPVKEQYCTKAWLKVWTDNKVGGGGGAAIICEKYIAPHPHPSVAPGLNR